MNESSIPPAAPGPAPVVPLTQSEERSWAMLAHLSVLLNLVTGIFGPLAPLLIYLFLKDRSRYVAYQSMQAFVFQLIWWLGGGALVGVAWTVTAVLLPFLVGLLCVPGALLFSLLPLAAIVYGVIGAIRCSEGQDFRYWLIGDWVRGTLTS